MIADRADTTNPDAVPLGRRVRAGVGWNASSSLIGQVIALIRAIVIARLLVPEDFGLLGMALTLIAGLTALTTIGLDQSILAHRFTDRDDLQKHLNTAWSAEVIRSLVLTLLVVACAFPLARFYGQPKLRVIIPVLSLSVLIQGFQNIGLVILRKEISFARIFWYELTSNLGGIVLTIGLVLVLRNVWGLVLGLLTGATLSVLLSYVFHSYRPRLAFDQTAFRRVSHFGKFALVIAVASYVTTTADNVMVGRMLGTSALGNYTLAYSLASVPIGVLVYALGRVLFPAYAEIAANRPAHLEQAFTKVFAISSLILIAITVPLFLLAGDVVQILFGSRWSSAGSVLRILVLIIPLRGLVLIATNVFFGLNLPKQVAVGKTWEAVVFLTVIYPLMVTCGLNGAAWAAVISYAFACINRVMALRKVIPGISSKLVRISLSTVTAAGAGLLVGGVSLAFLKSPLPRVIVGGVVASVTPALVLLLIRADLRKWVFAGSY
jgi:lipopolysaccharide exporter